MSKCSNPVKKANFIKSWIRKKYLLKYITKEKLGLEIGPYIHPLASKREGYNVKILDVFTDEELINH